MRKWNNAVHEAGHAVMVLRLGGEVVSVDIIPTREGQCLSRRRYLSPGRRALRAGGGEEARFAGLTSTQGRMETSDLWPMTPANVGGTRTFKQGVIAQKGGPIAATQKPTWR
jgi:hypothetical protein